MRIAAVITAYNSAATIERAIESVLQQTRPADDIVVVDDGSQDDTCAIVRRYGQVRLVERLNGGPAAARNTGLAAVDCDWLAFLDGDDRWLPEKLARVVEAAERHPEAVTLFSSVLAVAGDTVFEKAGAPEWVLGVDELLRGCPIVTPSCAVVRVDVARKLGGFNEAQRDGEDWEFWLRVAGEGPIRRVPGPLTVYYIHDGGWHTRYVATRTQATRFLVREAWRHLRKNGVGQLPVVVHGLGRHFRAFAYYASLERRVGLTMATGAAAIAADPIRGSYTAGRCLLRATTGR